MYQALFYMQKNKRRNQYDKIRIVENMKLIITIAKKKRRMFMENLYYGAYKCDRLDYELPIYDSIHVFKTKIGRDEWIKEDLKNRIILTETEAYMSVGDYLFDAKRWINDCFVHDEETYFVPSKGYLVENEILDSNIQHYLNVYKLIYSDNSYIIIRLNGTPDNVRYMLVGKLHNLFDADIRKCIDAIFGYKEKIIT